MRFLLIADIHSNPYPLYKCLEIEKNNFDAIIFLGDYISDMPKPEQTLDFLYSLSAAYPSYFIKGNREQYQIDCYNGKVKFTSRSSSSGSLLYTYNHLRDKDFAFLNSLRKTRLIDVPQYGNIRICHGTPESLYDLLRPSNESVIRMVQNMDTDILICAHSHVQFMYEANRKLIINPGSIGIPLESNGIPQYALLTIENGCAKVEFKHIDYDNSKIIADIYNSELLFEAPIYTKLIIHELQTGIDYMSSTLALAKRIAIESGIAFTKHCVPEECWEKAYYLMFKNVKNELHQ